MGLTKPRAAQIFNLDYKQSTRVVTTTNITLTGGAPTPVDSVNLSVGDRVLVTGQSTGSQNGLYQVQTVGSGANGTWVRTSDGNETGEIEAGMIVMVTEGTIYADTQWKLITDDPITLGTTALTFTQNYSANSISSGTSNVVINSNANVTVSSAGTANVLTVSNTGAFVSGVVSATGNITGNYILGNGALLTGVSTTSSNINNGTSNVTVVSSNGNVTVGIGGTGNVAVFSTSGLDVTGRISATGNITGGNVISGGVRAYKWTTQANTAPSDAVPGDAWYDSYASKYYLYVNDGTGNQWVDQSFPTSFYDLSVTGNIQGGNVLTNGLVSATGNITGSYFIGNGSQLTGLPAGYSNADVATFLASFGSNTISTTGTITAGNISPGNVTTTGQVSATGNITGGNIFTAGSISATGNINGSNLTIGNIVNSNGNGVGNIGSATTYFNTVFARATSAQYADLAEMYVADDTYAPGILVEFGGANEISITTQSHSTQVAGIVSTNPSYLMNASQHGKHVVAVALVGRVPCFVVGPICKGDRLVSSNLPGVATALIAEEYQPGCIVGKALEAYDSEEVGTIEVAVGRT